MAVATSTLLIASLAATAVGTGISAYSQYQAGKAQQKLNEYNAQMSDYNAKVQEQAALDRSRDARIAANAQRAQSLKLMARQRALWAKAGVVGSSGTPLLVQAEQAAQLEMGALETERTGNIEAGRMRQQAVLDRMQATSSRMAGKYARSAANLNAAGTILQGAGSVAGGAAYGRYNGII
jgi:hypothetical protein